MSERRRTPRRSVGIATLSVLAIGLVAWLAFAGARAADESSGNATVRMTDATVRMTDDMRFVPRTVRVKAGGKVTWRNTSSVPHTVTADPKLANDAAHVRLPGGASPFNSGNIAGGESYTRAFEVSGTYTYFCIPHEGQGMIGTIIVD